MGPGITGAPSDLVGDGGGVERVGHLRVGLAPDHFEWFVVGDGPAGDALGRASHVAGEAPGVGLQHGDASPVLKHVQDLGEIEVDAGLLDEAVVLGEELGSIAVK